MFVFLAPPPIRGQMESHPVWQVDCNVHGEHRKVSNHPKQRDRRRQDCSRQVRSPPLVHRDAEQRSGRDAKELALFGRGERQPGGRQAEGVDGRCRDHQMWKVKQNHGFKKIWFWMSFIVIKKLVYLAVKFWMSNSAWYILFNEDLNSCIKLLSCFIFGDTFTINTLLFHKYINDLLI